MHLEIVSSMCATVDNVQRRDRHHKFVGSLACQLSEICVQSDVFCISAGTSQGQRNCENSVCTELLLAPAPLILRAVELLDHESIDLLLLCTVHTLERGRNNVVYILYGLEAALSVEA